MITCGEHPLDWVGKKKRNTEIVLILCLHSHLRNEETSSELHVDFTSLSVMFYFSLCFSAVTVQQGSALSKAVWGLVFITLERQNLPWLCSEMTGESVRLSSDSGGMIQGIRNNSAWWRGAATGSDWR